MSSILGISAFYHDSAACILKNGKIVAAAQEERFTRKKHDPSYPKNAINFVLDYAKLEEAILNPKMLKEEGTREKPPTKEAIKFLKDNHPYQWELQKLRKKEGREAWEQKSCYRPGQ